MPKSYPYFLKTGAGRTIQVTNPEKGHHALEVIEGSDKGTIVDHYDEYYQASNAQKTGGTLTELETDVFNAFDRDLTPQQC